MVIVNLSLLKVYPDSLAVSLTVPSFTSNDFSLKTELGSDVPSTKRFCAVMVFTFVNLWSTVVYRRVVFA